jgi:hypothetical protein
MVEPISQLTGGRDGLTAKFKCQPISVGFLFNKPHLRSVWKGAPQYYTFAVRGNSNIMKLSDLKGKKLPFVPTPTIQKSMACLLAYAGLTWDDVQKIPTPTLRKVPPTGASLYPIGVLNSSTGPMLALAVPARYPFDAGSNWMSRTPGSNLTNHCPKNPCPVYWRLEMVPDQSNRAPR